MTKAGHPRLCGIEVADRRKRTARLRPEREIECIGMPQRFTLGRLEIPESTANHGTAAAMRHFATDQPRARSTGQHRGLLERNRRSHQRGFPRKGA